LVSLPDQFSRQPASIIPHAIPSRFKAADDEGDSQRKLKWSGITCPKS
jgi:hypothetical protein